LQEHGQPIERSSIIRREFGKVIGRRHLRHRRLMLQPAFLGLERGRHVEDLRAMLNGHDTSRREVIAVARAIDLVDDG
jgi:hypothetical protein